MIMHFRAVLKKASGDTLLPDGLQVLLGVGTAPPAYLANVNRLDLLGEGFGQLAVQGRVLLGIVAQQEKRKLGKELQEVAHFFQLVPVVALLGPEEVAPVVFDVAQL